jgi:hypothetical protein
VGTRFIFLSSSRLTGDPPSRRRYGGHSFGADAESIEEVYLGSARIITGTNTITFQSAGGDIGRYQLAVDRFNLTPSGLPLEAEWMTVDASSGATPAIQNMGSNETWSGNSRLNFPANAAGQSFTLDFVNDRWEERNFNGTADETERLDRIMVDDYTASTFGLELEGSGVVWRASEQTGSAAAAAYRTFGTNQRVRVQVRGDELYDGFNGGRLGFNGTNVWAGFQSTGMWVQISSAFIALASQSQNTNAAPHDYVPGTLVNFTFNGNWWSPSAPIFFGAIESSPVAYMIERSNTYILGFTIRADLLADPSMRMWSPAAGDTTINAFLEDSSGAWIADTNIYALGQVRAGHAPEGTYLSPVIDTTLADPDYTSISWTHTLPGGYTAPSPSVTMQARAGFSPDLSSVAWVDVSSGADPAIAGRYAQVKATLRAGVSSGSRETATPELHDFILAWTGDERFAPVSGKFQKGPSQGVYDVLVNGTPLMKGVTIDLTVYKDVTMGFGSPRRITASAFTEIIPRN